MTRRSTLSGGSGRTLCVLPALKVARSGDGRVHLTAKFLAGAAAYAERWPGRVLVAMEERTGEDENIGAVVCDPRELPFELEVIEAGGAAAIVDTLGPGSLVLATLVERHLDLAHGCGLRGVRLMYVAENPLSTRLDMIRAETRNPLLRWRRQVWSVRHEAHCREAIAHACGVQCNGLPAYEAYRGANGQAFLYFDTRVRERRLVDERVLEQRLERLRSGAPLRLAFTGRLTAIKGADHLPRVARALRRQGVEFTLDVCGSGPLEGRIRALAARWDLQPALRVRGVLDFDRELLDFVSREVDLFVCCHRQGDPSCTYLETMACGVPIAGYANEAFARLAAHARTGWATPLDDPGGLARRIALLDRDRAELERGARRAVAFAAQHLFEATMDRRVDHLVRATAAAERCAS